MDLRELGGHNVMVDLETLGTQPDAAIVSIGAAVFTARSGILDTFYMVVDPETAVADGATMDVSTILWWMQQSGEAKAVFKEQKVPIRTALTCFSAWIGGFDVQGVWGNGAAFDNVILQSAYRNAGMKAPWPFYKDRCYRTLRSMMDPLKEAAPGRSGVHHHALSDALHQAEHMVILANRAAGETPDE